MKTLSKIELFETKPLKQKHKIKIEYLLSNRFAIFSKLYNNTDMLV